MPDLPTLLRAHAHALLSDLLERGSPPARLSATVADAGWQVTLSVEPSPSPTPRQFTPCERDILTVLRDAPGRVTTSKLLAELARRGLVHGESTVKLALARLRRENVLGGSRRAPCGYWLLTLLALLCLI